MSSSTYDSAVHRPPVGDAGDASDASEESSGLILDAAGGDEDEYDVTNPSGRRAIIFRSGGSDVDCERLKKTLRKLSFTVDVREALSEESFANEKEEKLDCLLIVVLAHDKENDELSTEGSATLKSEIWTKFMANNWTTLAGKPKIFILQNCTKIVDRFPDVDFCMIAAEPLTQVEYSEKPSIPAEADLLVHTITTNVSCSVHRRSDESNLFIEELCKEFDANSKDDLLTMLTRVNAEFFRYAQVHKQYREMPSITSTLRKKIYLHHERNTASTFKSINDCYPISRCPVGRAIIFNNQTYAENWQQNRRGTEFDGDNLKETLEKLNFIVDVIPDPKDYVVKYKLLAEATSNLQKQYDCLVVVILTHGGEEGKLTAYNRGAHYNVADVWSKFLKRNCPSLASKPKIFIIQACRGYDESDAVFPLDASLVEPEDIEYNDKWRVPSEPDFLLAYSTFDDKVSARLENGTWYITELCEELRMSWKEQDLLSILTRVNRRVARKTANSIKKEGTYKQMPTFTSTLTKKIYFNGDDNRRNISSTTRLRADLEEDRRTSSGVDPKDSSSCNPWRLCVI